MSLLLFCGFGGWAAARIGFGFGGAEGSEDEGIDLWIELGGFGDGDEEVDGADPFVACGDEGGVGGGGWVWGGEASFFVFEGAEFFTECDPFVDVMGDGALLIFWSDEDIRQLAVDFGGDSGFELCGLAGFGAVGFLGAGEAVWDEEIAQCEQGGAFGFAEEEGGGCEEAVGSADEVVVSVVDEGLFFADFAEARVIGDGLGVGGEVVVSGMDAREAGGEVVGGEDGLVRFGFGVYPFSGDLEHFIGGDTFGGHGLGLLWWLCWLEMGDGRGE